MSGSHGHPSPGDQSSVDEHFRRAASYWDEIYGEDSLDGLIYQQRHATVCRWIDALGLPEGSPVLEIGCGAGALTIDLVRRGFVVQAVDSSDAMIDLARRRASKQGIDRNVSFDIADVHGLELPDDRFALVVAIGVLPWLHTPDLGVREMARVALPGGHVLLTADNRARLTHLLDPRLTPLLSPARSRVKHLLVRTGRRAPRVVPSTHWTSHVDRLAAAAGLRKVRSTTVGFGPFSLGGRSLLRDPTGIRLHRRLQALAWRDVPAVRSVGSHYVLLTRKPG
ncbi:MAG: class I SAM-dependent methyltransferase [Gaiellales bacterium]